MRATIWRQDSYNGMEVSCHRLVVEILVIRDWKPLLMQGDHLIHIRSLQWTVTQITWRWLVQFIFCWNAGTHVKAWPCIPNGFQFFESRWDKREHVGWLSDFLILWPSAKSIQIERTSEKTNENKNNNIQTKTQQHHETTSHLLLGSSHWVKFASSGLVSSDEPWPLNVVPLQPADQASPRKSSLASENHPSPSPHPLEIPWHGGWQAGETSTSLVVLLFCLVWSICMLVWWLYTICLK